MKTYWIEDRTSGFGFIMEMSHEAYMAILNVKDNLGYVMEDIAIKEYNPETDFNYGEDEEE